MLHQFPAQEAVEVVAQKDVNGGSGMLFSLQRECFPDPDGKRYYVRSDMYLSPDKDSDIIPSWLQRLSRNARAYSSGLADVQIEVIPYSFHNDPADRYYALTFRLMPYAVRKSVRLGASWNTDQIGKYILALTDITGEYRYAIGDLTEAGPVDLWQEEIDFK